MKNYLPELNEFVAELTAPGTTDCTPVVPIGTLFEPGNAFTDGAVLVITAIRRLSNWACCKRCCNCCCFNLCLILEQNGTGHLVSWQCLAW